MCHKGWQRHLWSNTPQRTSYLHSFLQLPLTFDTHIASMLSILVVGFVRRSKRYIFFFFFCPNIKQHLIWFLKFGIWLPTPQRTTQLCCVSFCSRCKLLHRPQFKDFFFLRVQGCDSTSKDKNKYDDLGCQSWDTPLSLPGKRKIDTMDAHRQQQWTLELLTALSKHCRCDAVVYWGDTNGFWGVSALLDITARRENGKEKWKRMTCNVCVGLEYQYSNVRDYLNKSQVSVLLRYKMCLRAVCNLRLLPRAVNK